MSALGIVTCTKTHMGSCTHNSPHVELAEFLSTSPEYHFLSLAQDRLCLSTDAHGQAGATLLWEEVITSRGPLPVHIPVNQPATLLTPLEGAPVPLLSSDAQVTVRVSLSITDNQERES